MKHGDVVLSFLVPANENAAKSIHPTMRPFYYPPARFGASVAFKFLCFLAAATNVRRKPKLLGDFSDLIIVIAFIHAHALLICRCWVGAFYRNALDGSLNHFHVVTVSSVHCHAYWNSLSLHQQASLDALLGAICWVFPCLFPPEGGFRHAPVH